MPRLKFFLNMQEAPKRFEGGLIPNLLGYHLLRILGFGLAFALRKNIIPKDANVKQAADEVTQDGIVVIPDFFPAETFASIKKEADAADLHLSNERAPRIMRSIFVTDGRPASSRLLEEHFAKNDFVNGVASAALRKEILVTPTVRVEKSWYAAEDLGKESTDKADNLHFDVSFPTIKCFLYLNDVDERNAAFMYAKGSHRMTWTRAWMEYVMSVKFWFWDKKSRDTITPEVDRNFLKEHGLELTSITGKANTLFIVNTMGFHRRGDYATTTPREVVHVSYRAMDSLKFFLRELRKTR